ncbi:MAG: hypothetical protein DMF68_08310 [Acidobacteria bacterium]|nr:MAG: hypothetical protein DMF68_08310 [Acidobacteriota bacterium]
MRKSLSPRSFTSLQRLLSVCALLFFCGAFSLVEAAGGPTILSDASSTRAIAFEAVTYRREPFPLTMPVQFSADTRNRIVLFAMNLDLLAGEGANALTADAEDSTHRHYTFTVENVTPFPGYEWMSQVTLRLSDDIGDVGDVLLRINLHGMSSNRVRVGIGHTGGGPSDDAGAVTTPAPFPAPQPTPVPTPNPYTNPAFATTNDSVRFLEQATWGPTFSDLAHVRSIGYSAYLSEQFNAPVTNYPTQDLYPTDSTVGCPSGTAPANCTRDRYSMYPLQISFFQRALTGQDQLRQRVSFALHKILVVSGRDLNNMPSWVGPYLQTLDRDAFGNFRQILEDVTLNPGMGNYLDMLGNTRVNPNENYAREIMQLFSVGVDQLNPDGTPKLDAQGNRIPTYDQTTITNFARVFTGWVLAPQKKWPVDGTTNVLNYQDPMVLSSNTNTYDTASKTLLNGVVAPAIVTGQNATVYKTNELKIALDNIFNHPNVGPYISRELIKQLVTSNPSPAYVQRVAATFNDNGQGVRGDMKAVIAAILIDPEARGDAKTDPNYGRLREPVQLVTNMLRTFNASSDGNISNTGTRFGLLLDMDQDLFNPPTVFSYFPADYSVPGTNSLFGPEFGILSTSDAFRRANFVNALLLANNGNGFPVAIPDRPTGTQLNYSSYQALAGNPQQLVDSLDAAMMHGTTSPSMKASIVQAVTNIASSNAALRTQTAIYLIATSSQYQVER